MLQDLLHVGVDVTSILFVDHSVLLQPHSLVHRHAEEVGLVVLLAEADGRVDGDLPARQLARRVDLVRRLLDGELLLALLVEVDHQLGDPLAQRLFVLEQNVPVHADHVHQLALDLEERVALGLAALQQLQLAQVPVVDRVSP